MHIVVYARGAGCLKMRGHSLLYMQAMEGPPRKVTFLPVVDVHQLVGLVTLHGLVSAGL